MLPIAVLPVAGLLLRLGQPDLLNIKWLADAGGAVFTNLPLIFALGVAVGFAKAFSEILGRKDSVFQVAPGNIHQANAPAGRNGVGIGVRSGG